MLALAAQKAEQDGQQDRARKQTANRHTTRAVRGEQGHGVPRRSSGEDARGEDHEGDGRHHRHSRVLAQPLDRRYSRGVADQRQQPDRAGSQSEGVGGAPAADPDVEELEGEADEHEGDRRVDRHPAGVHRVDLPRGLMEEELIDAEIAFEDVLAQDHGGDDEHDRPTRAPHGLGDAAGALPAQCPHRHAAQNEARGGVRLHRDLAGERDDPLERVDPEQPPDQHDEPGQRGEHRGGQGKTAQPRQAAMVFSLHAPGSLRASGPTAAGAQSNGTRPRSG